MWEQIAAGEACVGGVGGGVGGGETKCPSIFESQSISRQRCRGLVDSNSNENNNVSQFFPSTVLLLRLFISREQNSPLDFTNVVIVVKVA